MQAMAPYKKVLVVEDNPVNRAVLRKILEDQYVVIEAVNGLEALEVLKANNDISLILLDLLMPVMDGYEFLEEIQKDPVLSATPVIVTTQNTGEEDEIRSLAAGATDFVSKPYRSQIILHRVASILRLRETAAILRILQHDALTGLYTKEYFFHCAQEELLSNPGTKFNLICSDIENFKLINDAFGVQAGDRLLQEVASLLIRQVGTRGICGRFSGDRFICLLERRDDYSDEFFAKLNGQFNTLPLPKHLSIRWGIYQIDDHQTPVSLICDRALLAANSIKGQYGKLFSVYDEEMRSKLLREQSITDRMEPALDNDEFCVFLQPKYRLDDNALAGAEALVRWENPAWGLVLPNEFIPLFERNGFIARLDQCVWRKTCELLRSWKDRGLPQVPVSVNVSRADMYQIDLAPCLQGLVSEYGLSPADLHLEITESAFTEDPDQVIKVVDELREIGFLIEMDDFGSGYSSLNMLSQMRMDILKIDMRFIQGKTREQMDQGILHFIMSLAKTMELSVTAEGVETQEQLAWLRDNGCQHAQGYFFAKPMRHTEFEELLAQSGRQGAR